MAHLSPKCGWRHEKEKKFPPDVCIYAIIPLQAPCSLDESHHDRFLPPSWLMSVFCLRFSPDFLSICSTRSTKSACSVCKRPEAQEWSRRRREEGFIVAVVGEPCQSHSDRLASCRTSGRLKSCQKTTRCSTFSVWIEFLRGFRGIFFPEALIKTTCQKPYSGGWSARKTSSLCQLSDSAAQSLWCLQSREHGCMCTFFYV